MDEGLRQTLVDLCNVVERIGAHNGNADLCLRASRLRAKLLGYSTGATLGSIFGWPTT